MSESVDDIRRRVGTAQDNYKSNLITIEGILQKERGYVSRIPEGEPVIALYSGGMDSTVMINKVIEEWDVDVFPFFVKRGARAEAYEETAFDYFEEFYQSRFPRKMCKGAKLEMEIPPSQFKRYFPTELSLTVGHPLRNSTMANLAVMYAVALNGELGTDIKTILVASVRDDNTEPELGPLSLRSNTLNTCIQMGDWSWQVISPFTDLKLVEKPLEKVDLLRYAISNAIPLEKTRTCFSADELADGSCFACEKRLRAFELAGIEDPAEYNPGFHREIRDRRGGC